MKNIDPNISNLFGGIQKGAFSGIDLTEYSLIKKGSYKKALKSYYAEKSTDKVTADKTTSKVKSKAKPDEKFTAVKKTADNLTESLSKVSGKLEETSEDKFSAVKDFAASYNSVIDAASKVNSTDVTKGINSMKSMTSVMSKALNKVGITIDKDSKLSVDEAAFKNASAKDVTELFKEDKSYASMIKNYAEDISKASVSNSTMYNKEGQPTSSLQGLFDSFI